MVLRARVGGFALMQQAETTQAIDGRNVKEIERGGKDEMRTRGEEGASAERGSNSRITCTCDIRKFDAMRTSKDTSKAKKAKKP